MRAQRLRSLLAMLIMRSTGFPFDIDQVFTLNEEEIVVETTAYLVSMHTKTMLKNQITGGGVRRPFDWPLIGNPKIGNRLFLTLDILSQNAIRMTTCSTYSTDLAGENIPWNQQQFVSFLLQNITDHYLEIHRIRHGKSKNLELTLFIDLLTSENAEIAERLLVTKDPGAALFEELSQYKKKAKSGEKPQVTPERRFKIILSSLRHRVSEDRLEEISSDEIIDQIIDAFDAIIEVVEGHKDSLGEESERFAQALCFETAYRILQLLDVGEALMDLPWVSRFIAEESARSDISTGDMSNLEDEHRIRRIVSAYAGGLAYLILQSSK
jgi:dihydroxyacetone kinase DhaKLM complex PTS-EIIA-like component DhaM